MHLIDPEIMDILRGASAAVYVTGLSLGLAVWLSGWWGHRFWIVLFTTVIAGLIGLSTARVAGVQPFVAGLLLALAAGMLALALCRLLAFGAGGLAAWLLVRSVLPGWDEPLLVFLAGGLIGLFLFRPWLMALTSLAGALVMIYAGLGLLDLLGKLDAQAWADQRALLLNWVCGGAALLGWVLQFVLDRWRMSREYERHEQLQLRDAEEQLRDRLRRRFRWWGWTRHTPLDKAA
jgi:MFS family permease